MPDHYYTPLPASQHALRQFTANLFHREFSFLTDAGVFSRDGVDPGTRALIEAIPPLRGRALDLGCGWGAVGVLLGKKYPDVSLLMADVNERALSLAVANVEKNHMQARAVLSDGFERIEGMFDAVITNPPIRAGKAVIYKMFEDAKAHLKPGGMLVLVIRKQQGAPSALKFLKELYKKAEVIARDGGYWIIRCDA